LALGKAWIVLLTGGIIMAALAGWNLASGKPLPQALNRLILDATLILAAFFAWRRERTENLILKAQADRPDIRGTVWTKIGGNPYADQTRAGSILRFLVECANHGGSNPEMSRMRIDVTPSVGPVKACPSAIAPPSIRRVANGEQFRYEGSCLIEGLLPTLLPDDLRAAKLSSCILDSLGAEYRLETKEWDVPRNAGGKPPADY